MAKKKIKKKPIKTKLPGLHLADNEYVVALGHPGRDGGVVVIAGAKVKSKLGDKVSIRGKKRSDTTLVVIKD